jgi:hypothetical protein
MGTGARAVLVEESWTPLEVKGKPTFRWGPAPQDHKGKPIKPPSDLAPIGNLAAVGGQDTFHAFAEKAGKWYKADRRSDLFIMMKLDPMAAGAEDGWVYGTVSADGNRVTFAGRVASCMNCHETRPTRLFGLKPPEKEKAPMP